MVSKRLVDFMSVFSLVMKILGLFLGIFAIYLLAWKVFGHSPTSEGVILSMMSIMMVVLCAIIGLLFKMIYKIGGMEKDIKYIKRMMYALIKDFKNHTH